MERKLQNKLPEIEYTEVNDGCDLDSLLHPAQAFEHPSNVVNDPDLTLNEKRAILTSWASDACAVEAVPSLRYPPGGKKPVGFDDVMEALRALDKHAQHADTAARCRRSLRRDRLSKRSDSSEGNRGHGHTIN
jgi:hypothetical protein